MYTFLCTLPHLSPADQCSILICCIQIFRRRPRLGTRWQRSSAVYSRTWTVFLCMTLRPDSALGVQVCWHPIYNHVTKQCLAPVWQFDTFHISPFLSLCARCKLSLWPPQLTFFHRLAAVVEKYIRLAEFCWTDVVTRTNRSRALVLSDVRLGPLKMRTWK